MVADTYSSDGLGLLLMGTGNDNNTWGSNANTSVFQILADAIANVLTSAVTGGTLLLDATPPPAASSGARYAALKFTGILGSNQLVQVPNLNKWWLVCNKTSGGSASTAIPQNSGWQMVRCDGSNVIEVWPFNTGQTQMPDGSLSAPAYSNINETNSGLYRFGTQDWRMVINGAAVLQITGTGAATPSVVNVLSPNALQVAGLQVVPPGVEVPYAGITAPSGWYLEYGQAVTRATDTALLAAITLTATGNTHTNTTLDNLSTDLRNMGLEGAFIEGTGITLGTTIVSVDSATSLTLSGAASGTASISIRVLPYGQGDGSTTFNIPDRRGRTIAGRDNMGGSAASRLTSTGLGAAGTALNAVGGSETRTLVTANLPAYTPSGTVPITDPGHKHNLSFNVDASGGGGGAIVNGTFDGTSTTAVVTATTGITAGFTGTAQGGVSTPVADVQPTGISNMMIKR